MKQLEMVSALVVATASASCSVLPTGNSTETLLGLTGPADGAKLKFEVVATQPLEEGELAHWWRTHGEH